MWGSNWEFHRDTHVNHNEHAQEITEIHIWTVMSMRKKTMNIRTACRAMSICHLTLTLQVNPPPQVPRSRYQFARTPQKYWDCVSDNLPMKGLVQPSRPPPNSPDPDTNLSIWESSTEVLRLCIWQSTSEGASSAQQNPPPQIPQIQIPIWESSTEVLRLCIWQSTSEVTSPGQEKPPHPPNPQIQIPIWENKNWNT